MPLPTGQTPSNQLENLAVVNPHQLTSLSSINIFKKLNRKMTYSPCTISKDLPCVVRYNSQSDTDSEDEDRRGKQAGQSHAKDGKRSTRIRSNIAKRITYQWIVSQN
eukprot:447147_1